MRIIAAIAVWRGSRPKVANWQPITSRARTCHRQIRAQVPELMALDASARPERPVAERVSINA